MKRMKRIIISVLALGVCLTPLTVPLMVQPSWGQSQNSQVEELQRLIQQAIQQERQGQRQQAIQTLQHILAIARQLKERKIEAMALNHIGVSYNRIGQPQEALKYLNQALLITQEIGERYGEAATLNSIGAVYYSISQPQEALKYYNQALSISREVKDRAGEANTLNNIGGAYSIIGQPQEALKYYNQALLISREVGDRAREAITLNNIGLEYNSISQPQEALEYLLNQALPINQEVGNRAEVANTLNNIGVVYTSISQPQEALKYYNQALTIKREVSDRTGEAGTLNNIGAVYNKIGQPQEALKYYNQALLISQEVGNRYGEATTLSNIGVVYNRISQPQEALKYYNQALTIKREVGDRAGEAITLNNIGAVYDKISQPQEALKYYSQALPIMQAVGNRAGEAATLNNIGGVYSISQLQEALKYYNQALPIMQAVGNRAQEATTLSNIGFIYRDTKQPTQAIKNLQQSVQISLEMRAGLQQQNRQQFLESEGGTATALTDILIDQNQPDRAFQWVNLATTADLADYTRLINAKVKNPEAQQLIDQWNQRSQQIQFLSRQLQENFSDQLSQQINQLHEENSKLAEKIRRDFPEVAELFETTPQDISQLRSSIPPDTVVIQPVLLTNVKNVPNTIALFVLTKDQLSVVKIPIDPAEFDKLLTEHDRQLHGSCNQKACDGNSNYDGTGGQLYDILIRPIEDKLKAFSPKQLSIIATGKLRYIPFETLYDKQTEKFLIEKYPINYLTRISTRTIPDSTLQGGILALGNPVPRDPQNLPGSEAEVKTITQFLPGSIAYINNNATLAQFKTQAPRFPFLHLATHGCFQSGGCKNLGMNEGTLLFADSTLNIADAALLGLENTRLLTLSACQTALQANSNGEEISGIAYIFERAGARAVMATLWSVNDEETKELMIEFYRNINKGMSKVEALREAKISLIKTKPHPFFWSAFILIGDGR
ncbi:CHAT domain-containing protein [Phormidium nigroviride]